MFFKKKKIQYDFIQDRFRFQFNVTSIHNIIYFIFCINLVLASFSMTYTVILCIFFYIWYLLANYQVYVIATNNLVYFDLSVLKSELNFSWNQFSSSYVYFGNFSSFWFHVSTVVSRLPYIPCYECLKFTPLSWLSSDIHL